MMSTGRKTGPEEGPNAGPETHETPETQASSAAAGGAAEAGRGNPGPDLVSDPASELAPDPAPDVNQLHPITLRFSVDTLERVWAARSFDEGYPTIIAFCGAMIVLLSLLARAVGSAGTIVSDIAIVENPGRSAVLYLILFLLL